MATFTVPTTAEFLAALRFINLTENQKRMLVNHYQNRSAALIEIGGGGANFHYGALAHKIGDAIPGFTFDPYIKSGDPWYLSAIGTMDVKFKPFKLVMHDELAEAIKIMRGKGEL